MAKQKSYQQEAEKLVKAIEIAIDAYKTKPPKDWTPDIVTMVCTNFEKDKHSILNPKPEFKSLASLKYSIEAVFTYFQEASGETVEYFWNEINNQNLDYVRENKIEKIISRGKIRNRIEYEYATDMLVAAEQTGMITSAESEKLAQMLGAYELKNKR